MIKDQRLKLRVGNWETLCRDATLVRHEVFVQEQGVPVNIELDDEDAKSIHVVAYGHDNVLLGTGRLLTDGHIGRMAVRKTARGLGVGGEILEALIAQGREVGHRTLVLHAQTQATPFYQAHGFQIEGQTFMEAGIEHVLMRLTLASG